MSASSVRLEQLAPTVGLAEAQHALATVPAPLTGALSAHPSQLIDWHRDFRLWSETNARVIEGARGLQPAQHEPLADDAGFSLSAGERREMMHLLGELQDYLESVIGTHTVPGLAEVAPEYRRLVSHARRTWARAESWVKRLEAGR